MKSRFDFSDLNKPIAVTESPLEQIGKYAGKFNKAIEGSRLPAVAGGIVQGATDIGRSLGNIQLGALSKLLGKDVTIPHANLRQFLPEDKITSGAFLGGELAPALTGGIGAARGLGALGLGQQAAKVPGIGKGLSLAAKPAEGAAVGAALGESPEGDRGTAALIGGVANPLFAGANYLKNLNPSNLSKLLEKGAIKEREKYSALYNKLFEDAEKRGLGATELRKPQFDIDFIKKHTVKDYHGALDEFFKSPTLKNAHEAQSDLGKIIRKFKKQDQTSGLSSEEIKAYNEAVKAQKKIRGSMFQHLTKNGPQDLASQYGNITKGYKRDVILPEQSKEMKAAKKLAQQERLTKLIEEKYPELKHKKFAEYLPGKKALGYGLGIGGGVGATELLLNKLLGKRT